MDYLLCTHRRFEAAAAAAPLIMSDERLDFLGGLYLENPRLSLAGISFEMFLSDPRPFLGMQIAGILSADEAVAFLRLLPRQRAVRDRLDAADAGQMELALGVSEARLTAASPVVHDGSLVEKLRHHVWPKHANGASCGHSQRRPRHELR